MPFSENWPFQRVFVDHLFYGISRIWWEFLPSFSDPAPYVFQLQAGFTGNHSALDWVNLGSPVTGAAYLEDDSVREPAGKLILTHYRVLLQTSRNTYVSEPAPIWGLLAKKDWLTAQEIIRKERLRLGMTGFHCYLLKRYRYGAINPDSTDFLTNEVIDSRNPNSFGTKFKVGYHPPVVLPVDSTLWVHTETRGGGDPGKNSGLQVTLSPRMLAAPFLHLEDVLVDAQTDQRYAIDQIKILAAWRNIPLIIEPSMHLLPHDHIVYRIPVGQDSHELNDLFEAPLPAVGTGCVLIDHDYPTNENLTYENAHCCGIEGATILVFTAADWADGARTAEHAVAASQTTTNGRWAWSVKLDPGDYVLVFEKPGEYGPDNVTLTVEDPGPPPPLSAVSSESSSNSFGSF